MRVALIPPTAELAEFGNGSFHLLLTHIMTRPYLDHYSNQYERGAYLVLDNGAHENTSGAHMSQLLRRAIAVGASEIVLPDTLFDNVSTVARTTEALKYLTTTGASEYELIRARLMLVPQGGTRAEWQTCLQALLWTYDRAMRRHKLPPPVIGISKDYEMFEGGIPQLLERHVIPTGYDIHLLGWGRRLWVLREMAERWPQIRSTDSAKPFVYALNRIELDPSKEPPTYPRRTADYFERAFDDEQRDIARRNVEVFRATAGS